MSATITIRINPKTKDRLEKLAKVTDRTMSYFVSHVLEQAIEQEEWQIGEIKRRVELADKPGTRFIPHEDVEAWLKSWGATKERKPPKCG
ncbi:MAG: CopG family transcriptional regulator [Nitrospira bacterium HGW-Nitrospira-1]|nr:MAG: CopG family transcriptional regulator [Nitrospira bacterium HGW-Nitrospira-1]